MNDLIVQKTDETPSIKFLFDKHECFIEGESIPENAVEFYDVLICAYDDYIKEYSAVSSVGLTINFKMDYFNSSSLKMIHEFLIHVQKSNEKITHQTSINWTITDKEDEDLIETIEILEENIKIKITIIYT